MQDKNLSISKNDLAFLLGLRDSEMGEVTKYEMAEMYGISVDKIDDNLRKMDQLL